MGMTKRMMEDTIEEDFYPDDIDREYQHWILNKQLQDQEEYIKNFLEIKSAMEEMLADKY